MTLDLALDENELDFSNEFDHPVWNGQRHTLTTPGQADPEGGKRGTLLEDLGEGEFNGIFQFLSSNPGAWKTVTLWIRKEAQPAVFANLRLASGNVAGAVDIDLSNGRAHVGGSLQHEARVVESPKGWWRVALAAKEPPDSATFYVQLYPAAGPHARFPVHDAAATGGIVIYGMQAVPGRRLDPMPNYVETKGQLPSWARRDAPIEPVAPVDPELRRRKRRGLTLPRLDTFDLSELPGLSRQATALARSRPFLAYLAAATLLFGVYYGLIATPLYVSQTQFAIRTKEVAAPQSFLSSLVGAGGGGIGESIAVTEYLRSHEILDQLDQRHQLRRLYSRFRLDPFSTMARDADEETFLDFYRDMVTIQLDREANKIELHVRSFDPDSALAITTSILELAEDYINHISQRVRDETLRMAQDELNAARAHVLGVRLDMARFRNATGDLDPIQSGSAAVKATMELEGEVTKLRGELASLLTYSQEGAAQVQQLRARISSLEAQIVDQRRSLASSGVDSTLAEQLVEYEGLLVEREYSEKRLVAAMAALDVARTVAEQRERFIVPVVKPYRPDVATEPRRLSSFALAMLLALVGYGIVMFTIAGIRDHEGVV